MNSWRPPSSRLDWERVLGTRGTRSMICIGWRGERTEWPGRKRLTWRQRGKLPQCWAGSEFHVLRARVHNSDQICQYFAFRNGRSNSRRATTHSVFGLGVVHHGERYRTDVYAQKTRQREGRIDWGYSTMYKASRASVSSNPRDNRGPQRGNWPGERTKTYTSQPYYMASQSSLRLSFF